MESIQQVIDRFDFQGKTADCRAFGNGHINTTYIVTTDLPEGGQQRYVLQKVNHNVFRDIDRLMQNVFAVTSFLQEKIRAAGGDPDRETLHFIKTKDGAQYYTAPDGDYFRAYVFVKDSTSYDAVESAALFQKSGEAFGRFQHLLADFPAETLYETIPNFHNTLWRYENEFLPAVEADKAGRAAAVQAEIQFVKDRKADTHRLSDLAAAGQLPLRVTHNDTKLNNIMIDDATGKAICVIDLDTVMPGLTANDFGDSIRFGASTALEDERDLSKVSCDLHLFDVYAKGFIEGCGGALTDLEIEMLPMGAILMTFENGIRFLTDHLEGDHYFHIHREGHNLDRCRTQLTLVKDMQEKLPQMNEIIRKYK